MTLKEYQSQPAFDGDLLAAITERPMVGREGRTVKS
jgi:hypothetical protein